MGPPKLCRGNGDEGVTLVRRAESIKGHLEPVIKAGRFGDLEDSICLKHRTGVRRKGLALSVQEDQEPGKRPRIRRLHRDNPARCGCHRKKREERNRKRKQDKRAQRVCLEI